MRFGMKGEPAETSIEMLAMVRHCEYKSEAKYNWKDGSLLPESVKAITSTGMLLKKCLQDLNFLEPGMTLMATSDKVRARETAEILRAILGVVCITIPALGLNEWGDGYHESVILKAFQNIFVPGGGFQGLVVVTHEDQTSYLPAALHPKVSGLQSKLYYANVAIYDQNGHVKYLSPTERD